MANNPDYKLTIGIETHVQLKTKSKLFSGADNESGDSPPNTKVNHIDFGLPGALPVLNKKAIELASRAAFALNSQPQSFSKFDRKHYFYPDLPMGYQITQYDEPIIIGGYVDFSVEGKPKRVNITRAHLEADAGKSIHPDRANYSLVDLNRAGTPLLEIVSEPDMHSAAEAKAYARELYLLMRYADVSEANLYFGNMRFDVNVSVSKDQSPGTRTETKNLNSFRAVERAIAFEMKRQIELLEDGQKVIQQTRGWDDSKGSGFAMRSKENADDYRYMPDPDLPPVELSEEYISSVERSLPKLPAYWRELLSKHQLDSSMVESLIEGEIEYGLSILDFLSTLPSKQAKSIANWIVNVELPYRSATANKVSVDLDRGAMYAQVYELHEGGQLSSTNTKELVSKLLESEKRLEAKDLAAILGLIQNSDVSSLELIVDKVLKDNPKTVEDILAGQAKAAAFLVGQVMKVSKGQANPEIVGSLIKTKLKI